MRYQRPILLPLFLVTSMIFVALLFYPAIPVTSQTANKNLNALPPKPAPTATPESSAEVIKVDVDLVNVDALVLQKNTARIVGGLQKDDFLLYEDGIKQEVTHFSQDQLPLSVVLAIDRGPVCPHKIDTWSAEAHRAAREAIDRLKPIDEVAVMAFTDTAQLIQPFTRNRILLWTALDNIPEQAKTINGAHCFNISFVVSMSRSTIPYAWTRLAGAERILPNHRPPRTLRWNHRPIPSSMPINCGTTRIRCV